MSSTNRRTLLLAFALVGLVSPVIAASEFRGIDTDNDGTIDLNEAKAAAGAVFDKLEVNHSGTIDRAELRGRISEKDWATADPDHDGTLTKDECLNFVELAFKRADKDGEGTVDAKEARAPAGRALMRLLR